MTLKVLKMHYATKVSNRAYGHKNEYQISTVHYTFVASSYASMQSGYDE